MAFWKILSIICAVAVFAESKWSQHQKREAISSICDQYQNNTNKVQCYCTKQTANAECYQVAGNLSRDDPSWEGFRVLQNATKLTLTNTRGVHIEYIPTNALKHTKAILRLDVKYCNIELIDPYAFANLSLLADMTLRDNQIKTLSKYAFAHLARLRTLSLDQNNIMEINRDVFVDLPSLEQLFLTGNKLSTIHDKAFLHLTNLKELEIDRNYIFSLNNDTFTGLTNLEKLELSSNSLEVIGDNTFAPLINLRSLNLAENKISMLDEKAFSGLGRLQVLSLAHNSLTALENEKMFDGLAGLTSLNLKDNKISLIKAAAIAPILSNFYSKTSQITIDGNHFPCDCNLDVFQPLINKTQNEYLKSEIHNLQCYPSAEIKQRWENEKSTGEAFEEMEQTPQGENAVYEYYDETELNGTLFYVDMRFLLNCPWDKESSINVHLTNIDASKKGTNITKQNTLSTPKVTSSPVVVTSTTVKPIKNTPTRNIVEVDNRGNLDLSLTESTTSELSKTSSRENSTRKFGYKGKNEIREDKKDASYTTSRLATVSAKPVENKHYADHDMASDEAKPDRFKAHRSIQDEETPKFKANGARRNFGCVEIISIIYTCRLLF